MARKHLKRHHRLIIKTLRGLGYDVSISGGNQTYEKLVVRRHGQERVFSISCSPKNEDNAIRGAIRQVEKAFGA